ARVLVTGRKLLEWRTARDAQHTARSDPAGFYISMWILPVTAVTVTISLRIVRPESLAIAAPLLGLWMLAPGIAWWLSRPIRAALPRLSESELVFLGAVARRTWRFFEQFVGPADNDLP